MPKTTFAPENKANENSEKYPRLKLEKNARGRIVCVEEPEFQFVHALRAPKIVNGEAIKEIKKRKDETTYETYEMEFIGNPICFGDIGTLQDRGVDSKNCPACEASQRSDAVPGPTRRYAMNVIQYGLRPGGWELALPFSVRVVVWAFTARMFDQLVDLAQEWGNLREHDLLLGPCEDANYQKWPWKIAQQAAWMATPETRQHVAVAWQGRGTDKDLEAACGRRAPTIEWLKEDVNRTEQRWQMARHAGSAGGAGSGTLVSPAPSLAAGLDGLLDSANGNGQAAASDPFSGAPAAAVPSAVSPAAAPPAGTSPALSQSAGVSDPFAGAPAQDIPQAAVPQASPAAQPAAPTSLSDDPFSGAPAQSAAPIATPAPALNDPFAGSPQAVTPGPGTAASAPAPQATAPVPTAAVPVSPSEAPAPGATTTAKGADVSFDELLG